MKKKDWIEIFTSRKTLSNISFRKESSRKRGGNNPSECKDDAIQETVDDASLVWIGL